MGNDLRNWNPVRCRRRGSRLPDTKVCVEACPCIHIERGVCWIKTTVLLRSSGLATPGPIGAGRDKLDESTAEQRQSEETMERDRVEGVFRVRDTAGGKRGETPHSLKLAYSSTPMLFLDRERHDHRDNRDQHG